MVSHFLVLFLAIPMSELPPSAERGREALLTQAYLPPYWTKEAYDNVWKQWGVEAKPTDYDRTFRERYGLAPAPYPNKGLPMGLRESKGLFKVGITNDCMLCHGGSLFGKSYVGLGNTMLDMEALYQEMFEADGVKRANPFNFTQVRGTTEAGAMAVYLLRMRDEDLNLRPPIDHPYRTDLIEDAPAWWLLKKKKTMYHTGSTDARSVRSIMQFMLTPVNSGPLIKQREPAFVDVRQYLLSLEPPPYPFPIDDTKAARGERLFQNLCARCHGKYGPEPSYPNKIIPAKEIGTDPTRVNGFDPRTKEHYLRSWFGQEKGPDGMPMPLFEEIGYQAPPLEGVWATAPYFHNGSVPTLYHVLKSSARPVLYTRSFKTDEEDFDKDRVGWRYTEMKERPAKASVLEQRRIYDTTQSGRGNQGHTYGDDLSEDDRWAIIEYLKRL
jgi:mono/diheme cytochrome c family protein